MDYGYDIQKLYLELMLTDAETFVRCQSIFNHELFDKRLQETAEFINLYCTEYGAMPTFDIVNTSTNNNLKDPGELNEKHYDWLLDDFEKFSRHKALGKAIIESADLIEKEDYGSVEKIVRDAIQIGLQKDLGISYFENPKNRLNEIKSKNGQVSTGWPELDKRLFGGFNRGELNIFAGGSGSGKSLFLANLGVNWCLAGLNVLYLTFELSENLVCMRIDSMMTDMPTKDIFRNIDDVDLNVRMIGKKSGIFQVKYMKTGKNANDLRSYIKEFETQFGKKVDAVLVDYLDLMMPISAKVSPNDLFVKDKFVSEELRDLAMELNCLFVTASQLNRGAVEEIEFDHSHIAGGLSKINTADNVFGIFTSRAMRERGRYQLQLLKTRSSSGVGLKVDLGYDIDTLRISDIGEVDEDTSPAATNTSNIVNQIRRNTDNPSQGEAAPKISAETDTTKLRDFINNLAG